MEHLLSAWTGVSRHLKKAHHILLLMDYDGTLTPIVDKPELADLPADTRQLLRSMACKRDFTVGIVSGRGLVDLIDRVAIPGIVYAGNHGLEIEGPDTSYVSPAAAKARPILRTMSQALARSLKGLQGIIVEDKGLTLSVHYRMVKDSEVPQVEEIFRAITCGAEELEEVKITYGKKVYEVRPAVDWDKGKAIRLIVNEYSRKCRATGPFLVYIGDDRTDEDAFKAVREYDGISVLVGEPDQDTIARYFLRSPAEVAKFLAVLLDRNSEALHE